METALVTGGAGFLGSHVAQRLVESERVKVVVLDDLSGGKTANVPKGVLEFATGSVTSGALLAELFNRHKFSYVYHLGAYAAEHLSHRLRRFNYINNVVGSATLINEAIRNKVKCFVYTSSIAVYGHGRFGAPNREDDPLKPIDPYGIGKMAIELDLAAARETFGLNSIIFRPHNVYGERQNLTDPTRNVVAVFMNRILHGEPLKIFGDGNQQRAFTYVKDVANPIAEAPWVPRASNRTFNVGQDRFCTVNYLAKEVCKAMGMEKPSMFHTLPRKEVRDAISDHTNFYETFGLLNHTELTYGLAKMAAWAKSVGPQPSKSVEQLEIDP